MSLTKAFLFHLFYLLWLPVGNCGFSSLLIKKPWVPFTRLYLRKFEQENYLLSEKVLLSSGDNEFISDTAETAEIPIVLNNNRRFMCLSSTYFFRWINSPWIYWVHQWWPKFSEPIRWLEMHYNRGFWVITVGSAYAKRSFTCSSEERICRYTRKHRKAKSMQSSESPVTMVTTCLYSRATSCSESYK